MAGDVLIDAGQAGGFTDRLLEGTGVDVVAAGDTGSGVSGERVGGEDVLPDPFFWGVGVLTGQGVGEVDGAVAFGQVLLVDHLDPLEVFLEGEDEAIGKDGDAVLHSLAIVDGDKVLVEVEVLNTEADAFHEAESGAVEQFSDQLAGAGEAGDDAEGLVSGEDGGEALGAFSADGVEGKIALHSEHLTVEEEEGSEGLILGGGGDASLDGEVGEEGLDFWGAHLAGVAFVVEEDEAFDPGDIGLLGTDGIVLTADRIADLVQEFGRRFVR